MTPKRAFELAVELNDELSITEFQGRSHELAVLFEINLQVFTHSSDERPRWLKEMQIDENFRETRVRNKSEMR